MAEETVYREHVLFVTGPQRDQLYEHFVALFRGRADVEVRIDRRVRERRRGAGRLQGAERRVRDRRQRPPEWLVPPSGAV